MINRVKNNKRNKMKKILYILLLLLAPLYMVAQEKGSYISVSGGLGSTKLDSKLNDMFGEGVSNAKLGWNAGVGYSYYFTSKFGLSTGVGVSYYNTTVKYDGAFRSADYISLGQLVDDDNISGNPRNFDLRVRLANWQEKQRTYFLEIPLMLQMQHKLGYQERYGVYAGLGAKVQIPFNEKYKVKDGRNSSDERLNVSGFYSDSGIDYGAVGNPALIQHGYGSIHNPGEALGWSGNMDLKISYAASAELGVLIGLNPRCDLMIGGYLDYGLNNIKKGADKALLQAPSAYHPAANGNIGNGIIYNGLTNSAYTQKVKPVAFGVKIGVRMKLGKVASQFKNRGDDRYPTSHTKEVIYVTKDTCCANKNIEHVLKDYIDELSSKYKDPSYSDLSQEEKDILLQPIYFDLNKYVLKAEAIVVLDQIAEVVKKHPTYNLRIFGNTCDIASDQINIPLGLNRAKAAKAYLEKKGINGRRIHTFTQSSYSPELPNVNEPNRKHNRRCDFEVIKEK